MKAFFQILKLIIKYGAIVGIIIKTFQFFQDECLKAGIPGIEPSDLTDNDKREVK